jgi:choline dehydrogenase
MVDQVEEFDYVVIGAGSAGCALARRLSDLTGARILVLEAGGADERPDIHDPTAYYGLWGSEVDWKYETVPQPAADGRVIAVPRGRVLGGTSSLNGMVYIHGDRRDFDTWAYLGAHGWSFDEVGAAFNAMEGRGSYRDADAPATGPLMPAVVSNRSEISQVFIDACVEVGIPYNSDLNSGDLMGAAWNESTIFQGMRQSSYRAFLAGIADRRELVVETHALVQGLDVNPQGEIHRVEYLSNGRPCAVRVRREVILASGAIDTPRTLLLSGIGSAAELERVGVTPCIDLPEVGRNLVDHMLLGVAFGATREIDNKNPNITECCAFVKSNDAVLGSDIEISMGKEKNFVAGYDAPEHCFTLIPGITRPQSRGSLTLISSDPTVHPQIDPRHLAEPEDVHALVRGIEISREIANSRAFRPWNAGEVAPGNHVTSRELIQDYVRSVATTWFHPVGTCRMGVDSGAVVDQRLRVRGTSNLRIADASIMPEIVSCNTNAASMMIGWRAGDIIASEL